MSTEKIIFQCLWAAAGRSPRRKWERSALRRKEANAGDRKLTKVLIVDDEPSILRSTQLLLADMGFEVATCARAADVLPTMRAERPDLLLQDVRMPGLDLDALVRAIRADPDLAHIPILLFSASMDLDEIQDRVGASGTLEKPFNPSDIVQAIQGAVTTGGTA